MNYKEKIVNTTNDIEYTSKLDEGISDWLARQKDNMYTNKLNRSQKKIDNAEKIRNDKKINDSVVELRNYLLNSIKNDVSWTNLIKSLYNKDISSDVILPLIAKFIDNTDYKPGYKVVSYLAKNIINSNNINSENNDESNKEQNISDEKLHNRVLEFIKVIKDKGDFTDFQIESMAKLVKDEFLDSNIDIEALSDEALKRYSKDFPKNEIRDEKKVEENRTKTKEKIDTVMSALKSLGYNTETSKKMIKSIGYKDFEEKSVQDIIKKCLNANINK